MNKNAIAVREAYTHQRHLHSPRSRKTTKVGDHFFSHSRFFLDVAAGIFPNLA